MTTTRPSLNKSYAFAVAFAKCAALHDFNPVDLAELMTLSDRAFKAGENHCNLGTDATSAKVDRTYRDVEAKACAMGLSVEYPGLYPHFSRADGPVYLPSL